MAPQGPPAVEGRSAPRLLFVANVDWFFLSHRLPIAVAARDAGYDVHVAAASTDTSRAFRRERITFHPLPFQRKGTTWFRELSTLLAVGSLYRSLRPTLAHHVTIKPVLYGGLMARLYHIPAVVSAISGLGYVFLASGFKASLLRAGVQAAYRFSLGHRNSRVIFQNPDDRGLFLKAGLVSESQTVLIRGSGVDLSLFTPSEEPEGEPAVVLAARMLWDKGIGEFVEAARAIHRSGVKARFVLAGGTDPDNPAGIPEDRLTAWQAEGSVEWWGHCPDMVSVFRKCHAACLPSYREGLPKALIEAAACGLPIVASDAPGCREIVHHGENGFLVPVRDAVSIADALRQLIADGELRRRMGQRSRKIAEEHFGVQTVVSDTLAVYRELLS